jgi:hypothetical protein
MRDTIFKSTAEMPSKNNSNREVVRTALTMADAQMHNLMPGLMKVDNGTDNLPPPNRGKHY